MIQSNIKTWPEYLAWVRDQADRDLEHIEQIREDRAELLIGAARDAHAHGMDLEEVAQHLGVQRTYLAKIAKRYNLGTISGRKSSAS